MHDPKLEIELSYIKGSSNKEYNMKLVEVTDLLYQVEVAYGKIGYSLNKHFKPEEPSSYAAAERFFVAQAKAKIRKGYEIYYICEDAHRLLEAENVYA